MSAPVFSGKRPLVLVTGGARRVGRAIVEAFAARGCDVLLTCRTSTDEAASLCCAHTSEACTVAYEPLELSDSAGVERAAARWARDLPRMDVLVHNASVYEPSPLDVSLAHRAEAAWRVNALAPAILSAALAPRLGESSLSGGGSIVAMLDIHAMGRPRKGHPAYSMSKAALHELVRSMAIDLAPSVRVNAVAPGVVAWPEAGEESSPEAQRKYLRRVPLARAGTPKDAADTVAWLALDAPYLTGQTIRVDGGRWLT